uniref:ENTH domain-containing protein 1 isoform X1 n=1 Tax=Pogona vitticeps TaxID=103695 RepID=A0ABM5GF12_9SAUR
MALRRHVKNFVKNYSEAEIKVREATSNDPWGPSSSLMLDISDLTYNAVSLSEIMNMIWHRMNDHGKNWRHVYKSLTLLDYLLKNGSKKVIQLCQEGFFNIHVLKDFHHLDDAGKDQGFHVREKAKQVLALLKDEQLLHNEREIAHRTRRRTSYAMLFPQKPSAKAYAPTMAASDPTSEFVPLVEKVRYFVPKALPATEQSQPEQTPSKTEVVQETPALNIAAKNSSEDLIVFSEDESSPTAAQSTFSSKGSKEESETSTKAPDCNILNARCALTPSERNSLPQQKWDSGRKSKSSVLSIDMLKSPPRRRSSVHTHTVAATLYGVWSSNPEESVTTSKQLTPKLDLVCGHAAASVETIYKSPTFQAFDPLGDNVTNPTKSASTSEQFCEPTKASLQNLHYLIPADLSGHPAPRPDSTSSVGTTSSLSTFSTSSPESAVPNNTSQPHHVHPKWFAYLSPGQEPSSPFFKELKERIMHSFSPASAYEVDACASILSLLPDNSKCSVKNIDGLGSRTCRALGESWENNIVHNASSVPNPVTPSITKPLGEELVYMSAEQKGMAMLEEIKNTVCGLRGDFCSVARELHIIRTELTNMVASIQNIDKFFAALQSGKGDSDHL